MMFRSVEFWSGGRPHAPHLADPPGCPEAGSGFQTIAALREMERIERFVGFQFGDDRIVDQQVSDILPDDSAFVCHHNAMPLSNSQPEASQFHLESIFINLFEKALSKRIGHHERATDNALGDLVLIVLICVHLIWKATGKIFRTYRSADVI
jgi:hypothetical protein